MLHIFSKYLEKTQHSHLLNEFKENYYSHPDYPSLYAVTDSLNLLQVENLAIRLPKNQLEKLPVNFIAKITSVDDEEIVLVTKHENKISYQKENGQQHRIPLKIFMDIWTGITVLIEDNKEKPRKSHSKDKNIMWFGLLIISIFLFSFFNGDLSTSHLFFKITTMIGLFVGYFILQEKYEVENPTISKICNFNANASCDSVIKSEEGSSKWLSFSDLPILFFSIGFLTLSLNVAPESLIGLLSLLTFPVIGYSIYLQSIKIKKWCVICLIISGLLLIQGSFFLFTFSNISFSVEQFLNTAIVGIALSASWFIIKTQLVQNLNFLKKNNELSRFKRNFDLFSFLTKESKDLAELEKLMPVELGQENAPLKLSLFLSPSCGHCHTAYKNGIDLIKKYPDKIKLQIFYNLNLDNSENPYSDIAQNILQIAYFSGNGKKALDDWHIERMDLEVWLHKWKRPEIDEMVKTSLKKQYEWCRINEFHFTPVILINGLLFPKEYEIKELKYFLNDLIEEIECDPQKQNEKVGLQKI